MLAVKESSGSLLEVQDLMSAHDHVQPIIGWDGLMYPALAVGVEATIWGLTNVVPDACVALLNTALERDWESAIQQWRPLYPLVRYVEENGYVACVKAGCAIRGMSRSVDPVRRCGRLPADQVEQMSKLMEELRCRCPARVTETPCPFLQPVR